MRKLALIAFLSLRLSSAEDRFLQWMDRVAQEQLSARSASITKIRTPEEAKARQAFVRSKILELIRGLPDYQGPLNPRRTGLIEGDRYSIEKVIFESLPQFYVTANVYRPNQPGRYPGVLLPLGHWDQGKPAVQRIAANLALKGFVVLVYDPIGQGERAQAYDIRTGASLAGGSVEQHLMAGGQSILAGEGFARYRIWDAKRALDYLVSRPDVDAAKIGCTGCSGGGTLTTYISALDDRIKVAAPACYINTFRLLFSGPTGDSEQTFPNFLASGLDLPDYIELFAPKPWLIASTKEDFFPLEGARLAYEEARAWFGVFGAAEKLKWVVGPGGHGTPLEVREGIYDWMIRWLKAGHGDAKEETMQMLPDHQLFASEAGQVGGRQVYELIRESFRQRQKPGTTAGMLAEIRKWTRLDQTSAPVARVISQAGGADFDTQQIAFESEPGVEMAGKLWIPNAKGRKPAVVLVDWTDAMGERLAREGLVALGLNPRGSGTEIHPAYRFSGDWITNLRAMLIGRNLAAMRVADLIRAVDLLTARRDVNAASIKAASRNVAGMWVLMAAAIDPRIGKVWIDRMPYSLRASLDNPLNRNLHDVLIPGIALHWDVEDLVTAITPRTVIRTDPTDWVGRIVPNLGQSLYRTFEEPDDRFVRELSH